MECPTFLLLGELLLQTEYMEFLCSCVCLSSVVRKVFQVNPLHTVWHNPMAGPS